MAQTKEELLAYFTGLDTATLLKLQKYSKLLIIPEEDLLTNVTMSQMVDKAHRLADSLFPEWTNRSKSDFGEFLVEIFSLFSEKDFWYINAFANEGILSKMRSYSNAFSKASTLGYYPTLCKGATASFSVTFQKGDTVTYKRGDLIIVVGNRTFTNDDEFTVVASGGQTSMTLILHEGNYSADDITYNGMNITVRKSMIDVDSITLTIDNIRYSRVRNFGLSAPDSQEYMVLPEEDGSVTIYFGDGEFGFQPSVGVNARVEYRKCNGAEGNMVKQDSGIQDSLPERIALSSQMITDSSGGYTPESLASIKQKAPTFFRTRKAAINESTSQDILNTLAPVHKSKVTVDGNSVNYRIIPSSGAAEPTEDEITFIVENFNPYLIAGYEGAYTQNTYKDLITTANSSATKMIVEAIVSPGYNKDTIASTIRQVISDLTNPLVKAEYDKGFLKTDSDIAIKTATNGVQTVSYKLLVGGSEVVMPDVSLKVGEIFQVIDQNKLEVRVNAY